MSADAVSALIIGNEVLTAKVTEANGAHLISRLRERGVTLVGVHFIRDEVDEIVEQLMACRRRARFVITSGGVGPTHDDVTVRSVARALRRSIVMVPEIEAKLRAHYGDAVKPAALRMAEAPEGSRLVRCEDARFPVLECDGVYMLPGVPQLFKVQLEAVLPELPGAPVTLRQLFLNARESELAAVLDAAAIKRPHVAFGSYPTWGEGVEYQVKLTIEHTDAREADAAAEELKAALKQHLVREG